MPDWYSTLYTTCEVRNAGKSVATQEAALNAVNVLYAFAQREGIDLVARFKAAQFLDRIECEALRNFAQKSFGSEARKQAAAVALGRGKKGFVAAVPVVARQTQYMRLTYIAAFVAWLAAEILSNGDDQRTVEIAAMRDDLLSRRPLSGCTRDDVEDDAFTPQDNTLLTEIILAGAPRNPFRAEVQLRNQLAIELLRTTGMRRGEALNVWVRDVDLVKRHVSIVRRHDSKDDPRVAQPLVKTRQRSIPIGPGMVELITRYLAVRRGVPGASKHPYLLVTHKAGPTQGQPLTKLALDQVFATVQRAEPQLSHLTPHRLRHHFSSELARKQQETSRGLNDRENDRRVRNYVAGRSPESTVDAVYTQRETKRQARIVSLQVQEEMAAKQRRPAPPRK
jgi:integrase